jgi:hypothetical protein
MPPSPPVRPPVPVNPGVPKPPRRFKTGARPSPRYALARAHPHTIRGATPAQWFWLPQVLSMWLNDTNGDCVTAEEAAAKACCGILIADATVQTWASGNNVLNGADLDQVLALMVAAGFVQDGNTYNDGSYTSLDYSNEGVIQNAISVGPVKIGIDSTALPSTAGNQMGWSAFGGAPGQYANEDHCVGLWGYGPTAWLFQQLAVPLPAGAPPAGYYLFTWSTVGVVDHAWIMSCCGEAWLRTPTTVTVGSGTPAPDVVLTPTPVPPTPVPPTPVPPTPVPVGNVLTLTTALAPGSYLLGGLPAPQSVAALQALLGPAAVAAFTVRGIDWEAVLAAVLAFLASLQPLLLRR